MSFEIRLLKTEDAALVCRLREVLSDLRTAMEAIEFCTNVHDDLDNICPPAEEALWTTAVIRYGRCFGQGGRNWPIEAVIGRLECGLQARHDYYVALRNKLYAHTTGVGQDYRAIVSAHVMEDGRIESIGLGCAASYLSSPGRRSAKEFHELILVVQEGVNQLHDAELSGAIRRIKSRSWEEIAGEHYTGPEVVFDQTHPQIAREMNRRPK
jgi:hypothetical protein